MPSIELDLGKYVIVRPRKDGTHRVLFEVPKRLRPSGWLPTRPLPRDNALRKGNLSDPDEVKQIIQDAIDLNKELEDLKLGRTPQAYKPYSLRDLAFKWQTESNQWLDDWKDGGYKERTKKFYSKILRIYLSPWSISNNDRDVRQLDYPMLQTYLELYKKQPYVQRHLRATLQKLFGHAQRVGWTKTNVADGLKVVTIRRKPKILDWLEEDVDLYVDAALARGWIGGARLILGLWETCARPTDAITWRRGEHYNPATGVFDYATSKTDEEVSGLPVSKRLRQLLDDPVTLHLVYRPDGAPYAPVRDDQKLTDDFADLRAAVVALGGPYRKLRQLRHGGLQDGSDKGASDELLTGATAHTDPKTIKKYTRRSAKKGAALQKLRGLVE